MPRGRGRHQRRRYVSVNFDTGVITDETTGKTFQAEPFPPFIQKIIADGGLMKSLTKK